MLVNKIFLGPSVRAFPSLGAPLVECHGPIAKLCRYIVMAIPTVQ